jgi:hypothetical protein
MSDVSPESAPKQTCRTLVHTLAEHLVEFAAGIAVGEFGERPLLRHLLRSLHEAGPRHPRQRAADADAADAEIVRPAKATYESSAAGGPFEKYRALTWGLRLLAASERELTDRALYVEFEPRHFCKQIDVAGADGAATKAHIGRRQVERLDHAADILQDQRVCD